MRKILMLVLGATLVAAATAPAWAGYLCVADTSSRKGLMLFNPYDGSLVDSDWISMSADGCGNPVSARVVGPDEFWVTDKANDQIMRYQLSTKVHLGDITNANIVSPMGMEVLGNTVYVASNGSSLKKVAMLNALTYSVTGAFSTNLGAPWDVQLIDRGDGNGNRLLVDSGTTTGPKWNVDLYTLSGTFVETIHQSTTSNDYRQPQQMSVTPSNTILVASSVSPYGIWEYDAYGNYLADWRRTVTVRGVYPLGNGNIIFTDSNGVHVLDRATGNVTDTFTGRSCNYIEAGVPEPASLWLLAAAIGVLRRR